MIRIGGALGGCLGVYEDFSNDKKEAEENIMVEVSKGVGIYKNLEILSKYGSWIQKVESCEGEKARKCLF